MKENTQISYRTLCKSQPLSLSSYMRWKRRDAESRPLLAQPGPRKIMPLPIQEFKKDLQCLKYRTRRVKGVGVFYDRYKTMISRRALQKEVREARLEKNRRDRSMLKRIEWKHPGTAWAIDATEYKMGDRKVIVHATMDLASRYRLKHLVSRESSGSDVASHLKNLFIEHGAPLFLKKDNGSIFNNESVDEVMAQYGVIPLTSPPYYPRYNGAIEKSIRDLKNVLKEELHGTIHDLNHGSRPCLNGRTPCGVFHDHQLKRIFSMKERNDIFEWLRCHSLDIVRNMSNRDHSNLATAWRIAAENWLRCQNLITVTINNKVLPNLSKLCSHN